MIALRFELDNVLDALIGDFGLTGNAEKVYDDAGGVKADALFDGIINHPAEKRAWQILAIDVRDIGAQNERGLGANGNRLEIMRLTDRELDGIRGCVHECLYRCTEIFDTLKKNRFVKKAVIHSDIETAASTRVKKTIKTVFFHWTVSVQETGNLAQIKKSEIFVAAL